MGRNHFGTWDAGITKRQEYFEILTSTIPIQGRLIKGWLPVGPWFGDTL